MIRSSNNDDFILLLLRWSLPGIGYFAVWIVGSVTVTATRTRNCEIPEEILGNSIFAKTEL